MGPSTPHVSRLPVRQINMYYRREDCPLTGIPTHLSVDRRPKLTALVAATVVCLVLVALLAVLQVTHIHAVDSDADHCPLCVAMHSLVPFVVMMVALIFVRIGRASPVSLETRAITRYWHPTLFTRPPPVGC